MNSVAIVMDELKGPAFGAKSRLASRDMSVWPLFELGLKAFFSHASSSRVKREEEIEVILSS